MRVGVIGLGNIGGAVAGNLLADAHEVAVHDRDAARVEVLVKQGAAGARDPAEVARAAGITFLSLPTPEVVREVAEAWLEGSSAGDVLVDLSTNRPDALRALGDSLATRGRHLLEAPVSGGHVGAERRMLVFLVGGDEGIHARCRPLLEKLGRASFHFGPLGTGSVAKLVNSLLAFTSTWASLEGLAMAAKSGVDLRTLVEAVRTAGASNFYMDRMVETLDQRGRPPHFAMALAAKDAGLAAELARERGIPAPVAQGIAGVLRAAVDAGLGARDWSDLVERMEPPADVALHLPPPAAPRD